MPKPSPAVGASVTDAAAHLASINAASAAKAGKLAAVFDSIAAANEENPEGPPKSTVNQEVAYGKVVNGSAAPDQDEAILAAVRRQAIAEGRADEARRLYATATASAEDANRKLLEARARADAALAQAQDQLRKMQEEFQRAQNAIAEERAAHAAEVQRLKDEAQRKVQLEQVRMFNIGGAIAFAVAVGSVIIGGVAGLRSVGGLALLVAGLCFGMAQIVSYPWFKWACLSSVGLALATAVYVIFQGKQAKLAEGALKAVVPVLDDLYDSEPTKEGRENLDTKIFNRLLDIMTPAQRKAVHAIRGTDSVDPA